MSKDIYYTTQAAAQELGVSVRTVYRLIEEGKLKSVKRGKSHFFTESDINKLIEKGWQMKLLKAIYETLKFILCPTCDDEAGVHVCGQGRKCTSKNQNKKEQ